MIQLLYTVILSEMFVIVTLLFKTPFRKLVIMSLDRVKRGRGPVILTTVASTVFVVLLSSVYSMIKIQRRTIDDNGAVNPTDQVLMSTYLLEASLMGFVLFLCLMIDRLHNYIRELGLLRKAMEAAKNQNQAPEEKKAAEIATLKNKINKLEPEYETKVNMAKAAKTEAEALKKQSEGLLLEYDRLLEDNQNLKNQLGAMQRNS
jgi:B-cell receptor-associated protein 31